MGYVFLKQQLRIYFKAGIINEVVNKTVNGDINVAVIVVIIVNHIIPKRIDSP